MKAWINDRCLEIKLSCKETIVSLEPNQLQNTQVNILTDEELKAERRRYWDAAREKVLDGHPQIDGYIKKFETLDDYEKSLEGEK